jgi:hypothetical protein
MAYKRFFYRNGKKFGPYYYESYRDETGKIKKRYVGMNPNKKVVKNVDLVLESKENDNFYKRIDENNSGIDSNTVKLDNSNFRTLIILIILLILTDFLSFYFLFR